MTATPIIPGRMYRVTGAGVNLVVIARHGCDAVLIGLAAIWPSGD